VKYLFLLLSLNLFAIEIINKPIIFNELRIDLTKEYILKHYGLKVKDIKIIPRIIVIHWTTNNDFEGSYRRFINPTLSSDRPDIQKASALNVSAHFMVKRDGTIYRLMDETSMARHIIGLNYSSIGIENVGGEKNIDNLTSAQLEANIELIDYLTHKYRTIKYLIGHFEYTNFTEHPLWLEKDKSYRTKKYDPGEIFTDRLQKRFKNLH
jgi:N-acetylmuramoyl-L-alanine amidase